MSPQLREALQRCRAAVQTDTLTLTLDLSVASASAQDAVLSVLGYAGRSGTSLPAQAVDSFIQNVRREFGRLAAQSDVSALTFATLLSAFVHECRHVHDMRATRIGCELLLRDLPVYAGVGALIDALLGWQKGSSGRRIPWPFGENAFDEVALDQELRTDYIAALHARDWIDGCWTSKAHTEVPLSIKDLIECLGFCVQVEWLAVVFGHEVASQVLEAFVGKDMGASIYMRPSLLLHDVCRRRHSNYEPRVHDLPYLLLSALNAIGLEDSFDNTSRPRSEHPGYWFERFALAYAGQTTVDPKLRSLIAVDSVLDRTGLGYSARLTQANGAISALQASVLGKLGSRKDEIGSIGLTLHRHEALFIAPEVALDFRLMNRAISSTLHYHDPAHYVGLLMDGKLTAAHVHANTSAGAFDFLTPSEISANDAGGARIASIASQQMRILAFGRSDGFFESKIFHSLCDAPPDGRGLAFDFRPRIRAMRR